MAVLVMILRKMMKNKWLELSLLSGLILSVALVSSMPIYTDAILQRMLVKDLETMQKSTNQYPGIHRSSVIMNMPEEQHNQILRQIDSYMVEQAIPSFSLPMIYHVRERSTIRYPVTPVDPKKVDAKEKRFAIISAMSDMEEHIRLVDGRLPAAEPAGGVYEVLVVPSALTKQRMVIGNEFKIELAGKVIKFKPVGVIDKKNHNDLYWYTRNLNSFESSFFIPFALFEKDFSSGGQLPVRDSSWYTVLDYSAFTLSGVFDFINGNKLIDQYLHSVFRGEDYNFSTKAPILDTLNNFFDREKQLRTILWSLNVPVMIMLAYYLFMVSNLITGSQKTEIAVLRSRGASRLQILSGYLVEGVLLGAVAFAVGPYTGMLLTKILGSSNGFLEFVQRSALRVSINQQSFIYALYVAAASIVMTLIPALFATRTTIVGHKQQMARKHEQSIWHKYFIDVVLLAISIYGLINFRKRMEDLRSLGLQSSDLSVDPLLFVIPAFFILGMGLLILRLYPWMIRFIYWIGRKWWPPSIYSTLIQVGRSSTQYQFLMVFLIMTVAIGLFSASAARTLNQNTEDQLRYGNGADIVISTRWANNAVPSMGSAEAGDENEQELSGEKIQYIEPPFVPFTQLPGVEHAAKVFTKHNADFSVDSMSGTATLMGIDTADFGRTAWMRDRLLDHHLNEYLNLIATEPSAVLISRTLAEQSGVKEGDHISVGWSGLEKKSLIVYGIIDYFPTFNPNPQETGNAQMLIVGHLDYIQHHLSLEPYTVWLKIKPDASRQALIDALSANEIAVTGYEDTLGAIQEAKNDPFLLAINGVMTLGFLISVIISFFGFLLYWILSLSGRILQIGILRAIGISFRQLIGMLTTEQILTSGAAIFIGIITGTVTSRLFVPLFQLSFNPSVQVPPFRITLNSNDYLQMYMIITFMILAGLIILGIMLSRIKIHQAVKLGED